MFPCSCLKLNENEEVIESKEKTIDECQARITELEEEGKTSMYHNLEFVHSPNQTVFFVSGDTIVRVFNTT